MKSSLGEYVTEYTSPSHPISRNTSPVNAFQIIIVPSNELEMRLLPLREKLTAVTLRVCFLSEPVLTFLLSMSHTMIVVSSDPDARCLPSSENERQWTESVCPFNGSPSSFLSATFNTKIDPWSSPSTIEFPFGENTADTTRLKSICPSSISLFQTRHLVSTSHFLKIPSLVTTTIYLPPGK